LLHPEIVLQDTRYKIQDTRYKIQDTRCEFRIVIFLGTTSFKEKVVVRRGAGGAALSAPTQA
jgi:hypothetical protein